MSDGLNCSSDKKSNSDIAVALEQMVGVPSESASSGGIPNPSARDGYTNKLAFLLNATNSFEDTFSILTTKFLISLGRVLKYSSRPGYSMSFLPIKTSL